MNGGQEVEEIVWLEDPYNFDYVREGIAGRCVREGGLKGVYRLIGYENHKKRRKGIQVYHRRFWWLEKHDKGCPEAIEDYQKGITTPVEAVNPKNITIPEGVRVIKVYEIEKTVPECSYRSKKRSVEYNKAKEEKRPFMIIIKGNKYASFKWDIYRLDFDLSSEAQKKLNTILRDFLNSFSPKHRKQILKTSSWYGIGRTSGSTPQIRIFECRLLAKRLKKVIEDKKNWVDVMAKYMDEEIPE